MTNAQKVKELFERVAGDKLDKVQARVVELQAQGKSLERAMADALFDFRLVNNTPRED